MDCTTTCSGPCGCAPCPGCWEDWQYATTLDADDPLIVAAVAALKQSLGLTDEQVEAILAASVAE